MLEFFKSLDRSVFLFLNNLHADWLDPLVFSMTNKLMWLPLFIIVIGAIIYQYRWRSLIILFFLALVILLADQISSAFIKPLAERLRPTHETELLPFIHIVNGYKGGLYGFVSSHAANAFGVATFLWLAMRKQITWIWIMFVWALIFSYTRIYLGVHYPGDIFFGGLLGGLIGWGTYKTMNSIPRIKKALI